MRNGDVWLTTEGDGIARFDGRTVTTYTTNHGLPGNVSRALFEDSRGTIWAGTRDGLARFDRGRFLTLAHTRGLVVRALAEDLAGTIWVGGRDQVFRLVGDRLVDTGEDGTTKLPGGTTRVMHRDRYGAMWVGTNVSLTRWFEGKARVFTAQDGLPPDPIYCIHEDADGTLWLGSYGGGITRLKDGRFSRFRQADGLYDDVAYHILEDTQGHFWISCNNGVYRVSKGDLNAFAAGTITRIPSTAYDAGDGALSGECNGNAAPAGWKTLDGRLWFPTTTGALIVDPANVRKNDRPPLVALESVLANRTPVDSSRDATFRPGTSQVTFTYTALSYIAPHKLRFHYLLEGLESEWVDAGSRRQNTYSNLAPGRYTFRVRAANNDGVWSEADARFVFVLQPRVHQTLWFRALLVLALVGLVGAGFRLRMWRLVQRQRELTAHVEQALGRIKVLSGLIPICASCKNIRDDQGYWSQLEQYLKTHSEARFSHGICPDCMTKLYPDFSGHEPPA
jgi:hypothetical protein